MGSLVPEGDTEITHDSRREGMSPRQSAPSAPPFTGDTTKAQTHLPGAAQQVSEEVWTRTQLPGLPVQCSSYSAMPP